MIEMVRSACRWLWRKIRYPQLDLGEVPAHRQSKYGNYNRDGDTL
jgi:hypothetical protein